MTERRQHSEYWAAGIDENLAGVGGDAWGYPVATGLRVPTLASPNPDPGGNSNRYLFLLCGFELDTNDKARIRGWRQYVTIGGNVPQGGGHRITELEVTSPQFKFPDGNVSFHLMFVDPTTLRSYRFERQPFTNGRENLVLRMSQTPALLAETVTLTLSGYYVDLTAYTAPNNGHPYGQPLAHLSDVTDLRTQWRTQGAWRALDIPVRGRGFVGLFASVRQTAGVTITAPTDPGALPPEERYIAAFPNLIRYWHVGGALDVFHEE